MKTSRRLIHLHHNLFSFFQHNHEHESCSRAEDELHEQSSEVSPPTAQSTSSSVFSSGFRFLKRDTIFLSVGGSTVDRRPQYIHRLRLTKRKQYYLHLYILAFSGLFLWQTLPMHVKQNVALSALIGTVAELVPWKRFNGWDVRLNVCDVTRSGIFPSHHPQQWRTVMSWV